LKTNLLGDRGGTAAKFLSKVVGNFLQDVAVFMNWCEMSSIDSLWQSLQMQWQGVGTLIAHRASALSIAALNMCP
jgi:hypothetical protein